MADECKAPEWGWFDTVVSFLGLGIYRVRDGRLVEVPYSQWRAEGVRQPQEVDA